MALYRNPLTSVLPTNLSLSISGRLTLGYFGFGLHWHCTEVWFGVENNLYVLSELLSISVYGDASSSKSRELIHCS